MEQKEKKRAQFAWVMYDWANSAFVTTITAAVLPIYYSSVAAVNLPANLRTAYWGYTSTIALLLVALLGPVLGAMADFSGAKKKFLTRFVLLGIFGAALLFLVREGNWLMASIFYILGNVGFSSPYGSGSKSLYGASLKVKRTSIRSRLASAVWRIHSARSENIKNCLNSLSLFGSITMASERSSPWPPFTAQSWNSAP